MKRDKEAALEVIRAAVTELVNERVPVADLVLSKKLSKMAYQTLVSARTTRPTPPLLRPPKEHRTPVLAQVPHLEVRKAIQRREPSRTPMLGDRECSLQQTFFKVSKTLTILFLASQASRTSCRQG